MKSSTKLLILLTLCFSGIYCMTGCQNTKSDKAGEESTDPLAEDDQPRIISLNGFLTELLYALDAGDQIVGVDVTSTYPPEVNNLEKLGHISQLNAEGILSLDPDIIFVESGQLKQSQALTQIQNSTVAIVPVPVSYHLNNSLRAARAIAGHIAIDTRTLRNLEDQIKLDSLALSDYLSQQESVPSVLFIYARGGGNLMVAGSKTSAQAMIEKAGGRNAITSFEQFRALTPESLIEAAPDIILMFDSGLKSLNGKEGLEAIPGMQQIPAFKNDRIITMDGHYLTSFGPRAGQAALELAKKIHDGNSDS